MKKITQFNNFCRVYQLPLKRSCEFCHNGGIPVLFRMVDWFNPVPFSVDFKNKESQEIWNENLERLVSFIKEKNYIKPNNKYIIITDFDESFIIET